MKPSSSFGLPGDLDACRTLLRGGSRTFYAASLLLPSRVRDPAIALYAFCRVADDAVDLAQEDGLSTATAAARALARLHTRLERVYAGDPLPQPADRAFADVVKRFAIPMTLPLALLEGFEWDTNGRRYETIEDLQAYAVRVAGTVGAMMALLMEVRTPEALARACDLGIGMQLTNIARDVGEDARAGRLYLPLAWLQEEGIHPEAWMANPQFDPRIARVVARLLAAADEAYQRARDGVSALPADCRPGIDAAGRLYAEIGRQVERQQLDSVSTRAVVSGGRKLRVALPALTAVVRRAGAGRAQPAIRAAQFLINAVMQEPVEPKIRVDERAGFPVPAPVRGVWRWLSAVDDRLGRILEMLERLEREERAGMRGVSRI
ncbi:MAG: phytoene/squalene synthase family protein [Betaproteobacteria bacterium]|nr:phytoene/squalene synthase family protein [Betaproteobacteria bacterium]